MLMFEYRYEHRVRYREADPMGIVYHTHYLDYFEAARTEALRAAGLAYNSLEQGGMFMPVVDVSLTYKRPARYDDLIVVHTRMILSSSTTRLRFDYDVFRKNEPSVLVSGHVTLCFYDRNLEKPIRAPRQVVSLLTELNAVEAKPETETTQAP